MTESEISIPEQAITDALKAAPDQHIALGHWEPIMSRADMRRTLEAAAPHLAAATECARITVLEQLATHILSTFHPTGDGHRARAGQVQIAKWRAILEPQPPQHAPGTPERLAAPQPPVPAEHPVHAPHMPEQP